MEMESLSHTNGLGLVLWLLKRIESQVSEFSDQGKDVAS